MYSPEYMARINRLRNAIKFESADQIPTISTASAWMAYDSPYDVKEAYVNYEVAEKVVREYVQRYQFDCYSYAFKTHGLAVTGALGGGSYKLDPKTGAMYVHDHNYLFPEEYEEYAKDPMKYLKVCFARKYPDMTTPKFVGAINEFLKFGQWSAKCDSMLRNELSAPQIYDAAAGALPALENLNASLRGIKDIAMDVRRHKKGLKAYLDSTWEKMIWPGLVARAAQPSNDDYVVDFHIAMLAHSFLSVKQFEELYWPYMKQAIDLFAANNKTVYVFCENSMMRFKEFFQEVPKDMMILHLEDDDLMEVRKELPNICLAGGLPVEHTGHGTPEQCVDDVKRLVDNLGGGYIMGLTKVAAYKDDVKRENMLAVMDYCRNTKG